MSQTVIICSVLSCHLSVHQFTVFIFISKSNHPPMSTFDCANYQIIAMELNAMKIKAPDGSGVNEISGSELAIMETILI